MFAKLKKQVKEKADDVATTETSAVVRKTIENSRQKAEDETTKSQRQRVKSNSVSADENQSSDERSSTKSSTQTKTTTAITTESNKETNSNETSSVQSEPNDRTINNQNQSDNSYKTQLQQLNQSLLNQIDLLAVSSSLTFR